ncbi:MAG: DNA alkylation repair protein [Rikenellaceae bacterium]|nr:DNA alkylation repair protein [Rikenellaceae bacterium]
MVNKSKNDRMVEILRRMKPERHGAVVEAMAERGVSYGASYGVAIPVIRRVAGEYAPDHALAEYLFLQDVRELKLAAVYVDDPAEVTAEQMNRWAEAMPTDEVMEHAAMQLFYAAPDAPKVIRAWLTGADRSRWKGALQMIGRQAMKGILNERQAADLLNVIEQFLLTADDLPRRASVFALERLAGVSPELSRQTLALTTRLKQSPHPSLREIAEETEALL